MTRRTSRFRGILRPVRLGAGAGPRQERRCGHDRGYCGTSAALDDAIGKFAMAYAKQTEQDHAALDNARRTAGSRSPPTSCDGSAALIGANLQRSLTLRACESFGRWLHTYLTLRNGAKRSVSKGGNRHVPMHIMIAAAPFFAFHPSRRSASLRSSG